MTRYINIVLPNQSFEIKDFQNVAVDALDTVANFSNDMIYCSILNKINKEAINPIILSLINKLRPGGQIIFVFNDIKKISRLFADGSIKDEEFLGVMQNTANLYFLGDFEELFNQHLINDFFILNTEFKDYTINIHLQRNLI